MVSSNKLEDSFGGIRINNGLSVSNTLLKNTIIIYIGSLRKGYHIMVKLGRIEKLSDLRKVWPDEARDFTPWLANNLDLLNNELDLTLELVEKESNVGEFSCDILAKESGTNNYAVIENQIEKTNHDHLGKLLTYAAGKQAKYVIWIAKTVTEPHRAAVEWLNQHTDDDVGFFLLEVELWKIGDSEIAPRFNIIERPNSWAKIVKSYEGISEIGKKQLDYWQAFRDYAFNREDMTKEFNPTSPHPQNWYDCWLSKKPYHIFTTVLFSENRIAAGLYISNNKDIFNMFKENREEFEKELGCKITWSEATKDCRIFATYNNAVLDNQNKWNTYFDWQCEMMLKFKKLAYKYDTSE